MYTLVAFVALATAEFCAEPVDGGQGEPQFCRFEQVQTIYTPYFSVDVHPSLLAGVDQSGRHLMAQPSIRQSPVSLSILASETLSWSGCSVEQSEMVIGSVTWMLCDESSDNHVSRRLTAQGEGMYLTVSYGYSELGAEFAEAIEDMVRSIRLLQ